MIELIIFDNDGVLIDSEIIWHQFCAAELSRLGYPMSVEKSLNLFSGVSHEKTPSQILENEFGVPNAPVDFAKIGSQTEANYASLLKPINEIEHVLDFLDNNNVIKCIASNGDIDYVQSTLRITNLKKYFADEAIFSVQGSIKPKPEPDVFLQAAQAYSVAPEQCLVIEDHPLGIEAAKTAKMPVIGFLAASHTQNDHHRQRITLSKPSMIADSVNELLVILKEQLI